MSCAVCDFRGGSPSDHEPWCPNFMRGPVLDMSTEPTLFDVLEADGEQLDSLGERLEECPWCGGEAEPGSTCPRSLACPQCGAEPGASCVRPSGHRAAQLHAPRVALAEGRG